MAGLFTWGEAGDAYRKAKIGVVSIVLGLFTLVGGYISVTEVFVTKAHAKEMVSEVKQELSKELRELKIQTKANKSILVEMQMIRIENKIARDEKLTPTEKRVYQKLQKQYEEF